VIGRVIFEVAWTVIRRNGLVSSRLMSRKNPNHFSVIRASLRPQYLFDRARRSQNVMRAQFRTMPGRFPLHQMMQQINPVLLDYHPFERECT
jgi:hypothetical protein